MMRTSILLPLLLLCAALSAGCASTPSGEAKPKYAGFLSDYSKLQPVPDGDGAERYRKPNVELEAIQQGDAGSHSGLVQG